MKAFLTIALAMVAVCVWAGDSISEGVFGKLPNGETVHVYTLRNVHGMEARILDYGGIIVSLSVPDREGKFGDVLLGCDTLESYMKDSPYFGAIVGRYANRIAQGKFTLEGRQYVLAVNDPPNHLHGGLKGFDKVLWTATVKGSSLELKYLSKDGEEGYPGDLSVTAVYSLSDDNALRLDISATTDKDTVCNITNHAYFNLAGKGDILKHEVTIPSDFITPTDAHSIPLGFLMKSAGSPFDFNAPTAIGARIGQDNEQLRFGRGYDHNFVIRKIPGEISLMAKVFEPSTGRVLEVFSNQPGVQFYSGNFLDGTASGKGRKYEYRNALCLEPQHYPDSPNRPAFPSVLLKPGQTYHNVIIFKFSTEK